jgi:hypothetical protein
MRASMLNAGLLALAVLLLATATASAQDAAAAELQLDPTLAAAAAAPRDPNAMPDLLSRTFQPVPEKEKWTKVRPWPHGSSRVRPCRHACRGA